MRMIAILSVVLAAAAQALPPTAAQIALYQACRGDIKRLCGSVPAGGGAIATCLQANQSKISQGCVDAFLKYRAAETPPAEPAPQTSETPGEPTPPPAPN